MNGGAAPCQVFTPEQANTIRLENEVAQQAETIARLTTALEAINRMALRDFPEGGLNEDSRKTISSFARAALGAT